MNQLDAFYCDKKTLNSGYIFFDDSKKATTFINKLSSKHIRYSKYVVCADGNTYFGFHVFGIADRFFDFCKVLKEVLENG